LSGAERRDGHLLAVGGGLGDRLEPAAGQEVEAEVPAAFGPFVVLLGQDGADQADGGVPVREDPDDVGAPADLPVEPLGGVVRPDLPPDLLGKAVKASTSARAASRCSATVGSLPVGASRTRSNWACTLAASGWS